MGKTKETCGVEGDLSYDLISQINGYLDLDHDVINDEFDDLVSPKRSASTEPFAEAPKIVRSSSAPPIHCIPNGPSDSEEDLSTDSLNDISIGGKKLSQNIYASWEYFNLYYSKNPLDRSLPPPLYNVLTNTAPAKNPVVDLPTNKISTKPSPVIKPIARKPKAVVKPIAQYKQEQVPQPQVVEREVSFEDLLARERKLDIKNHFNQQSQFSHPGSIVPARAKTWPSHQANGPAQHGPSYHVNGPAPHDPSRHVNIPAHHGPPHANGPSHHTPPHHGGYDYSNYQSNGYGQYGSPYEPSYPYYGNHQNMMRPGPNAYPRNYLNQYQPKRQGFRWNGRNPQKSLLDELKEKSGGKSVLLELVKSGHLVDVIIGSEGSRYVQTCLETASVEEKNAVFHALSPKINYLCTDPFGNYVIQKFFDYGNDEHKPFIIKQLMGAILELSLDMYGCRVVQKAIDHSSSDTLVMLVRELNERNGVVKCIRDQNGNHVVQKCIERAEPYVIQIIMHTFQKYIADLAKHVYGCRVVQRLLRHCDQKQTISILMQIFTETEELSKNEFGNYVIQYIVSHGDSRDRKSIVDRIRSKILSLSKNKFGSNVIEKCFQFADEFDRMKCLNEVLGDINDPNPPLLEMIKDQYGNYVIQKMIEVCNESQKYKIFSRIRMLNVDLSKFPFGKYTLTRMRAMEEAGRSPILTGRTVPEKTGPKICLPN
jgi:hypothetical protein